MSIKSDYHLHSYHSGDSEEAMENHIKRAIELGFENICFTEHHDIDYKGINENENDMFTLNTDSYLYELLGLKSKYKNQINVLFGVEIGFQPHLRRELAIYSKSHEFDFIIGSVHVIDKKDPYYSELFKNYSSEELIRLYFKELYEGLKVYSNFDVLGHLDYITRYCKLSDNEYTYDKYKDAIDPILEKILDMEKGIEINTSPLASGNYEPNPCRDILKKYRQLGGEIITIGSDAHCAKDLGRNFDTASDILLECGFKYYTTFDKRIAEYHKL